MWRLISIVLPAENTAKVWLTRVGYLRQRPRVLGAGVDGDVVRPATAGRRRRAESEDAKVERFTRDLMEKSGGRWLVGVIGVVLIGVGIYFVVKGVTGRRSATSSSRAASVRSATRRSSRSAGSAGSAAAS